MRRFLVFTVVAVALFGVLAPPVMAQAPAPKVTITGLFDQITSTGKNFYDGNYARSSDGDWYARTRFRPDFAFEVGRTKAVLGLEIDLGYGQSQPTDGGFPANATGGFGTSHGPIGGLDINTDIAGLIEVKWIYTEFDLTGKDSLMPFIPVPTVARAGGQPFGTLANYKVAYANGDFAGVSAVTTFAPNLKTTFAYVMVEDEHAGQSRGGALARTSRGDDFAVIVSAELTPIKGLDIKPLYSYFHAEGITSGSARRGATNRFSGTAGGSTTAAAATWGGGNVAGSTDHQENRHTIGFDARWRSGPFGLDPTVYYQWGTRDNQCLCPVNGAGFSQQRVEAKQSAVFVDVTGSFQAGPVLLEARGIYSTGNQARDNLSRRISYFEPLDVDTSYYAGWAQILALGVDYYNGGGGHNNGMSTNVGYDRYGRAQFGVRGTYNVTPALALYMIVSPTWTAEKVDTDTGGGAVRTIVNDKSFLEGDSRYLGTEFDAGMTWRFAPNTAFDLVGAWLAAGDALDITETLNGVATRRDSKDAWTIASRVRLSF
jgi:hypothetical protein